MLRQFGYASLLFPSAGTFANHSDFDNAVCVLLDINLGDRLKAAGNTVPVIYMTGNDNPTIRTSALESGCLAYFTCFGLHSLRKAQRPLTYINRVCRFYRPPYGAG